MQTTAKKKLSEFRLLRESIITPIDKWIEEHAQEYFSRDIPLSVLVKKHYEPLEMIELQVRDAVVKFNQKGYTTSFSGFYGWDNPHIQYIAGPFTIEPRTRALLAYHDVIVTRDDGTPYGGHMTTVMFFADEPNISSIKTKWDFIASMLPAKR